MNMLIIPNHMNCNLIFGKYLQARFFFLHHRDLLRFMKILKHFLTSSISSLSENIPRKSLPGPGASTPPKSNMTALMLMGWSFWPDVVVELRQAAWGGNLARC